ANGIAVLVDSNGQLGTVSSSRRFKDDIVDMADASGALLELRPVTFRYKERKARGEQAIEYGLIAEEVAEVFPDLVVYDEEGRALTVRYHILSSLLLNELLKQHQMLEEQAARLVELEAEMR
ncbi:MAG: tail fiber domain-containing protein, partial [bacterium]|nr:tail fiber domain-containing protein [bacterium]